MAVFLLVGCTESKIVNPDAENYKGEYDWDKAGDELNKAYKEDENSQITGLGFAAEEGNALIIFGITVKDGTSSDEAAQLATEVVKAFNDEIVKQDSKITKSSEGFYGGLFEEYSIDIKVSPESEKGDETKWLVNTMIPGGTNDPIMSVEQEEIEETRDNMEEQLDEDQDEDHGPGTVPTEAPSFEEKPE
jgi:hypothetical protein